MRLTDIALLVTSAGGLGGVAALITSFRGRKTQEALRDNIVNNHDTYLRNDIDDIQAAVDGVLEGQNRILQQLEKQDEKITSSNKRVDRGLGEMQRMIESEAVERRRDVDIIHKRIESRQE